MKGGQRAGPSEITQTEGNRHLSLPKMTGMHAFSSSIVSPVTLTPYTEYTPLPADDNPPAGSVQHYTLPLRNCGATGPYLVPDYKSQTEHTVFFLYLPGGFSYFEPADLILSNAQGKL